MVRMMIVHVLKIMHDVTEKGALSFQCFFRLLLKIMSAILFYVVFIKIKTR